VKSNWFSAEFAGELNPKTGKLAFGKQQGQESGKEQ
jgi:hypothetical protein